MKKNGALLAASLIAFILTISIRPHHATANAEAPSILMPDSSTITGAGWMKSIGGSDQDEIHAIQETSDGGFIAVGQTHSFGSGPDLDYWILKLGGAGNVLWQKTYGGSESDVARDIQVTSDGGFIVAGHTYSYGAGDADIWVLKLNSDGDIVWQKTYGDSGYEHATSIQETGDGGFVVAGYTTSFGAGLRDYWVLKLDNTGVPQWRNTYGGSGDDEANAIQQTSDGGFIVAGRTNSFGAGQFDYWVLKLNSNGTIAWQKTYGEAFYDDEARSIQETSDGGYIVVGLARFDFVPDTGGDIWILKLTSSGTVLWNFAYGGLGNDGANSVQETSDGGFIVGGYTTSFIPTPTGASWLLKLNSNGSIDWQKSYDGSSAEPLNAVRETSDNGFIAVGYTSSFGAGDYDGWVLKTDSEGNIGGECPFVGMTDAEPMDTPLSILPTDAADQPSPVAYGETSVSPLDSAATVTPVCGVVCQPSTNVSLNPNLSLSISTGTNSNFWLVRFSLANGSNQTVIQTSVPACFSNTFNTNFVPPNPPITSICSILYDPALPGVVAQHCASVP